MSSESTFRVRLGGCAEAAHELNQSRRCVMDVQSILLEAGDNLRQLRMIQRTLDLHPVTPAPPVASPHATPHPPQRSHMTSGEAVRPAKIALPMLYFDSTSSFPLSGQDSGAVMERTPRSSPSKRTFTPVSTMQRLAHPVAAGLPASVVAANALSFVAAWRREDSNSAGQEEVVHDCLQVRYDTEQEEEGSRNRLRNLLLTVSEQMDRFAIMGEYDKFAVFCIDHEPVWRQAARQLQKENDARFNSTENIYARFVMEETALSEKMKMYQEAADYVLSQRFAEWELRRAAQKSAVERRRRQSASHITPVPAEPRQRAVAVAAAAAAAATAATPPPERRRAGTDAAGHAAPPHVPHRPTDAPERHSGRSRDRAAAPSPPSKAVEPLTSVEVDPYRERWRAIVGYFSGGERGKPTTHAATAAEAKRQSSPTPAAPPAARAEGQRAALPPAVRDGRFSAMAEASSMESEEDRRRRARNSNRHEGSGARDDIAVLPKPKDEAKKKETRSADGAARPPTPRRDAEKEERRRRDEKEKRSRDTDKEEKRSRDTDKEEKRRRDAERENKRAREARTNGRALHHHQPEGKVHS